MSRHKNADGEALLRGTTNIAATSINQYGTVPDAHADAATTGTATVTQYLVAG